jgi:penicillin-binding protein 2
MFEERTGRDTANLAMIAFRLGIVITFVVMVARMFQLQVMQNEQYETLANRNRLLRIETAAPRGVIYDSSGTILVRNRPSFEVALVPEDLPFDDPDTEGS